MSSTGMRRKKNTLQGRSGRRKASLGCDTADIVPLGDQGFGRNKGQGRRSRGREDRWERPNRRVRRDMQTPSKVQHRELDEVAAGTGAGQDGHKRPWWLV